MLEKIISYFDKVGNPYIIDKDGDSVNFLAKMNNSSFHCLMEVRESIPLIAFYSTIPVSVPKDRRPAVSELITRINFTVIFGNFEMDFEDGELRYKTSIDLEDIQITDSILDNLIGGNLSLSDDYFFSIMEVIMSDISPKEALEKREVSEE